MKLFGKEFSRALIETTSNPFVGLFIGILATSVIQSSSSTTSIVVGMVAAGALNIESAIPIVMGANIGTSITNTVASLPQINRSNEFQRAFAAATVHDFFNFLSVIIILPLQLTTNYLGQAAAFLGESFQGVGGLDFFSPVKILTKPIVALILDNIGKEFVWISFIAAILLLFLALKYMVSSLKSIFMERARNWFDKVIFKNAARALIVGMLLTALVQSSSITTSLVVPMAGAGIVTLAQIFPYTLGSNIGTTLTAILAALLTGKLDAIIIAFAHLLFNISGIVIWLPFKRFPIFIAEKFAEYSIKSKIIPVAYVLVVFFIIPLTIIYISN